MRRRYLAVLAAAFIYSLSIAPATAHVERHHARQGADDSERGSASEDVTISDSVRVAEDQVHEGDVCSVMGDVQIEGRVNGDTVVVLGDLDLSGTVKGDVVSILSHPKIASTARIEGDLVNVGWSFDGNIDRHQVGGEIVNVNFLSLIPLAGRGGGLSGLFRIIFIIKLMWLAAMFLIVLLITALVPRRLATISAAFPQRWGYAILAGLLAYTSLVIAVLLLAATIIGIPLAGALWCAFLVVKWLGLASILFLIGHTAGRNLFGRDLPHIASVLGGFVVYAVVCLVPFFGLTFALAVNVMGVGIAILTRFGSDEPWRRAAATPASPQIPPPPPPEPAASPEAVPPRL